MNNKKILIVDDELDVLEFLSYNFKKQNYHVACALNGKEGIKIAHEFKPHIIISDIMMPIMNGNVMSETLGADANLKNTPVIFLSAVQDEITVLRAAKSGSDFVSKPISFELLLKIVESHLNTQP